MGFLTENRLSNIIDIPIALPATSLLMGDWVIVASVSIVEPMRLTYTVANLQLLESSVDTAEITDGNKIYGNLGFAYLAMRLNYTNGTPGAAGGLDVLIGDALDMFSRNTAASVVVTAPGVYSWVVANNMQPSTDTSPIISTSTSIDFKLAVTGAVRLELDHS